MTNEGKRHSLDHNDIVDLLIDMRINQGYTRVNLLKFIQEEFKYSAPHAYKLLSRAAKEFESRAIQNFGEDLKEDIERFEALYESAIKSNNKKEAREVLKEIAKLKGHYTQRIELSGELKLQNIEVIIKKNESKD